MDDDAAALRHHRRHERTVEPDGRHQVEVEFLGPFRVVQRRETARRAGRPAEHVNDDIDPAQALAYRGSEPGAAAGSSQVGVDEHLLAQDLGPGSRGGENARAECVEQGDGGRACPRVPEVMSARLLSRVRNAVIR